MDNLSEPHLPTSNLLVVFGISGKSWATVKVDALVAGPVTWPRCSVRVKAESRLHRGISLALQGLGGENPPSPSRFYCFPPILVVAGSGSRCGTGMKMTLESKAGQ